ncbi:MAG: ABC transporter ATP-binding protein [Hespellia sp.]|nr:ABC transporter ATP-binding protein [Hespellia sp.]
MEKIRVEHVSYAYRSKYQTIQALKDVSCEFESGKIYAITGESGSGKSTLLSLLAGLDVPKEGSVFVDGKDLKKMDRDAYRREVVSVVYQSFHLFPLLNALENVMYPMQLKGMRRRKAQERATEYIKSVGLSEKIIHQFPKMMSGGEQQRVAIARALAGEGSILLADEPTGNLDTDNEENIAEILKACAHERGYTVIVVTHNPELARQADCIYRMKDGQLEKGK